ncbi:MULTISPECIES: baseplate J/gp47 family protein [Pseudomonas]|uniref:baseplate J/gp47 family protein n=1 Tax=Pseudomonas TaxID=286 RepID=UPI001E4F43BB|nr:MULTISPECIES: baseplate J/gp47 family protein [Pseudomonas]MCE1113765.1 baseplate J/gp47 family protein [Pseudomonas sp. NMI795_08]
MPFKPPSYEGIRDSILRDIRSQLPDADIGSDSDNFIRAAAVSAAIEGLYQHQAWLYRQIFPDTADEAEMLHHAGNRNIRRRDSVAATGIVTISGTAGVSLNSGSALKHVATGVLLNSTAAVTISASGSAQVPVLAQNTGASSNGLSGAVMLTSPPLGIDAMASIDKPLAGGGDIEASASVLVRLLDLMRNPPAGGAGYDYKRWALEIDGVASATILPKRRGPNTVDVVITGQDGAPSDQVVAACAEHIEKLRPVTAEVFVFPPLIRVVDAKANIELVSGYTLADVQSAAQTAYNLELGAIEPNVSLKRNRINTVLGNLAGVADYELLTPTSNIEPTDVDGAIGWIRPGTLTLQVFN